ncbi:ribosome silencing factor [bacterium]|nr:ribosome silencing factor [bacterium]
MKSYDLAHYCSEIIYDKKGEDIIILDVRKITDIADYFIICTALTQNHVNAILLELEKKLKKTGLKPWHVEGKENKKWILLDFVDVVIHIFLKETREYYALEKLWGDAPVETIGDEDV